MSIVKRGKGEEVKDYRGVTLMPILYKIYVTVLLEENFWLARGVTQGCPLSALLFIILISDMEEEMRKKGWGGLSVRK